MSIDIVNQKTAKMMTVKELKSLRTNKLRDRLNLLRGLQHSYEMSNWLPEERDAAEINGLIAFKKSDLWKTAFADVKNLLAERDYLSKFGKK